MNRILIGTCAAFALAASAVLAGQELPALTDAQKARIELHVLRVELARVKAQLAEAQAREASCALTAERHAIDAEVLTWGYTMDWEQVTLIPVASETPKQP